MTSISLAGQLRAAVIEVRAFAKTVVSVPLELIRLVRLAEDAVSVLEEISSADQGIGITPEEKKILTAITKLLKENP